MYSTSPQFTKPNETIEQKITGIIDKMTLDEKIEMLGGQKGAGATIGCERVGIPEFRMADGPVGVHWWCDYSTAYPATIAASASWNTELVERLGNALGSDCRARGVHMLLAPGVNIFRSPLCGRNFEYLGEDPHLSSRMVVAYVKGVQSHAVTATVKHYACNFQEYDRHGIGTDVDERTLREVYLPAFEAAVKEGGAGAIMTAYNLVNGEHCSQSTELIQNILRDEWGFDGIVMSDWTSTYDAIGAANAGLDLEMPWARFLTSEKLKPAIGNGLVTENTINQKIRRLLRLAFCFGWMDSSQLDETIAQDDPRSVEVALDVAREGAVLLKNNDLLPFDLSEVKTIAVIGYQAHPAVISGGGSAYTQPFHAVSVLEGVRQYLGDRVEVIYEQGFDPQPYATTADREDFHLGDGSKGVQVAFYDGEIGGNPKESRIDPKISTWWGQRPPAEGLNPENFSGRWRAFYTAKESGKHRIYLVTSGKISIDLDGRNIFYWEPQSEGDRRSNVEIDLEEGKTYEILISAHFTANWNMLGVGIACDMEWERMRQRAIDAAGEADAVLFCGGFSRESETEGADRTFDLPLEQGRLIRDIAGKNPGTAVVLFSGGGVAMEEWLEHVKGLLQVWYPGQEGGKAIAEILFGHTNPSGKLPATFDRRLEDRSSYNNYHDPDGDYRVRITDGVFTGYRHNDRSGIEPLFPFGYGLSYTTFAIEDFKVSAEKLTRKKKLRISAKVKNTGTRAGAEVLQVYVGDVSASVPRPVKELKGFAKVFLEPGKSKRARISLDENAWKFWDPDKHAWVVEPGEFDLFIGTSSKDILHTQRIVVEK